MVAEAGEILVTEQGPLEEAPTKLVVNHMWVISVGVAVAIATAFTLSAILKAHYITGIGVAWLT